MKEELYIIITVTLLIILIALSLRYLENKIFFNDPIWNNMTETYDRCCNGTPCSDTVYVEGRCHLTLCESMALFNRDKCVYDAVEK